MTCRIPSVSLQHAQEGARHGDAESRKGCGGIRVLEVVDNHDGRQGRASYSLQRGMFLQTSAIRSRGAPDRSASCQPLPTSSQVRHMTQRTLAEVFGIDQPKVLLLVNGRFADSRCTAPGFDCRLGPRRGSRLRRKPVGARLASRRGSTYRCAMIPVHRRRLATLLISCFRSLVLFIYSCDDRRHPCPIGHNTQQNPAVVPSVRDTLLVSPYHSQRQVRPSVAHQSPPSGDP